MTDIDYFKRYNDHYGHTAGDRCLRLVAACLADNTRDTDLAARFGGEEFAIVMPHTDTDTAARVARDLRDAVAALAEPHPLGIDHMITLSIGVAATIPTTDNQPQSLIDLADVELYRAKRAGRNRVEVAHPHPASL